LLKEINKNDYIGRWGGEEFMVLMKNTKIDQAKLLMDELREKISKKSLSNRDSILTCTVSIGLSQWHDSSDDIESLFIKADRALYRAKKAGRNKVEF